MNDNNLGQIVRYPLSIKNGKPEFSSSREAIEQGISSLLSTPKGSRFYLPEYGSRLNELLFEQSDELIFPMIRLFVVEAINIWEKRITFTDIAFSRVDDSIDCEIFYKMNNTNEVLNFIYNFNSESPILSV